MILFPYHDFFLGRAAPLAEPLLRDSFLAEGCFLTTAFFAAVFATGFASIFFSAVFFGSAEPRPQRSALRRGAGEGTVTMGMSNL